MATINRLTADVSASHRGDYFFAHLLMPHYPYVYDARCNLRPVDEWLDRSTPDAPEGMTNTAESRALRYSNYGEQIRCLYKKIGGILEAIPSELRSDATIIVQGDHGSRITLAPLRRSASPLKSASDYIDGYSTLFAVRSPKVNSGYDSRMVAITCLLKTLTEDDRFSLNGLDRCEKKPTVFVQVNRQMVARHLPEEWYGSRD
jgi:hypothetical protein